MPTYQYVCEDCNTSQDLKRNVDERDDEVLCEQCSKAMKRTFGSPAITFNGPGFYSTGG